MTQEVHGLIGCPGSGKSTLANTYDPTKWVVCTFDDLRQAMWPPHRRTYWEVRKTESGSAAQKVLHHVHSALIISALENGFSVLSADTNIGEKYAVDIMNMAGMFGITVKWKVLDVPLHVLQKRNSERCEKSMRVPESVLTEKYEKLWDNNAWWRSQDVEIIKYHPTEISEDESVSTALTKLIKDHPMTALEAEVSEKHRDIFITLLSASLTTDRDIITKVVYKRLGWA